MKTMFLLSLLFVLVACGKDVKKSKSYHLSEDIQMNAQIFGNQIQLSSVQKMTASSPNVCGPSPMPGKVYNYGIMGDVLTISDQSIQVRYQRVIDMGGIFGTWKLISSTDSRLRSGSVEIGYGTIRFISNCG